MEFQKIGITCDHAGFAMSECILKHLQDAGVSCVDLRCPPDQESVSYPHFGGLLGQAVSESSIDGGIAVCGTGIGMCIVANKFSGVRAACVWDDNSAKLSREHNNCNVLCLGARTMSNDKASMLVEIWIHNSFGNGRHQVRLNDLKKIEEKNIKPH